MRAGVVMVSRDFVSRTLKSGTGVWRLTKVSVARSSKRPSSLHSMRISCGVSTVKRAFPASTTARGSAWGFPAVAAPSVSHRAVRRIVALFIFQGLVCLIDTRRGQNDESAVQFFCLWDQESASGRADGSSGRSSSVSASAISSVRAACRRLVCRLAVLRSRSPTRMMLSLPVQRRLWASS